MQGNQNFGRILVTLMSFGRGDRMRRCGKPDWLPNKAGGGAQWSGRSYQVTTTNALKYLGIYVPEYQPYKSLNVMEG